MTALHKKTSWGKKHKNVGTLYQLARDILWKGEIHKTEKSCVFKNDCNPSLTYGTKHRQEPRTMSVP
jgi:hypothetical protein